VSDNDVVTARGRRPGWALRRHRLRPEGRRRRISGFLALSTGAMLLVACGGGPGPNTLTWYINPDSGGQAEIAKRCTAEANGRYSIQTNLLPREASAQREQLIRRLAAKDDSIDLMSLDPPFIPEFAEAGFLADIPQDVASKVTENVVESAVEGATWQDKLVTIPFWANTQLLWYRKSVAQAAGLDMSKPVTWEQLVQAAKSQNKTLAVQGIRAEALTVFINALIESAGGSIIEEQGKKPQDIKLGFTTDAGREAASTARMIADAHVSGPALSNENEDASATLFESGDGGFMVNWPFVYPRAIDAEKQGSLPKGTAEGYGWALYPRVDAGKPTAPPYGGINLGIGAFSKKKDIALEAAQCIVKPENQSYYFVTNGNPAANETVYDDPEVLKAFPMAPTIRESLKMAAPRPKTPYYNEVTVGIQRTWHPLSSVNPDTTPGATEKLIKAVLAKKELL
jgi:multiple sugar transport system substrate-binding protein